MAKSESRLLSGRIKTKSGNTLDSRRTTFLSLDNAEPNFGNPDSDRYILASLANGERLFLKLNTGFLVSADSVSGDESTFEIDPTGLANADGTTLAEVLDDLDSAISIALLSGSVTDDNFNGDGTTLSPLTLDSDLRIFGITGDSATFRNITRTGTTVTAGTYGSRTDVPVFTVDSSGFIDSIGEIIISDTLNTAAETGTGSVSLLDSALNIAAGEGINTVASGNTITVSGEDASITNKGIAHFDSGDFTVSSGYVSVKTSGIDNDQLAGGITNDKLVNTTITLGSTTVALGDSSNNLTIDSADITKLDVTGIATLASASVTDLTNDRIVIAGVSGELEDDANLTYNGSTLTVANSTASTNSANGALVVTGGVGIGGALNVNGNTEIAGDLTVTGTTTTIEVQTLAIHDPLIHLADSNESGDEVDIGFIGHYYDLALGGRQHTGLFRDATDDKYYLFAQYKDSALDSSPRSNVIDRSRPSFVLADFNAATIFADTFSGTVSADSITTANFTATTVDINGGTIDGTTIATSDITVGAGKTLDVSAGTLTLANDQISGDKVEGGTINAITINNLTSGNVNIDDGFIDGTAIGHTTPDSGTFTNLARTSPSGVTSGTYGSVTNVPVVTVDASGFIDSIGEVAISTTLNTAAENGTGSVNLLDSSLNIAAGEGINTTASGRTITIAGEDASTSNKGVASFDAGDFSVSSGAVSIKTAGVGNDQLEFDSVTVTAGSGLIGGGTIALGSSAELKLDSAAVKGLFSGGANINYNNSTGEIAVAASGVVSGKYGTPTKIPVITVDSYGQVDSIGLVPAQASLGDTIDSIFHNPLTGELRVVTDVASFFTNIVLDPYTTDSLSEGTTNLYYTKTRVDSDIDQAFNENPSFGGTGAPFSVSSNTVVTNLNADLLDGFHGSSYLRSDAEDFKTSGDLIFNDNVVLAFGNSEDLRIYHDQTNSYIQEIGTGDLKILTNGQSIILEDSVNDKISGQFTPSGSVDLYYNGSKKFETTNTGVDVTGNVVADGGTIDGQLFVNYSSTSSPAILVTSTDGNSQASPELELYKNSTSASGHYLGQLKFTGENSTGGKKTYAKITGKILDNTNGSEDGIIEVAFQKAGSNNIAARFRSDRLDLINGTALNVNGDIYTDSDLSANNITRRNTTVTAGTYGAATSVPIFTVDTSGFIDSISTTALNTTLNISAETGTGSLSLLDSSLDIAAGSGIDTTASNNTITVEIDSADLAAYFSKVIVHDNTNGFVADEHVAHSSINITAGSGLTGGGSIASSRTLNVGEGTGIAVTADAISTNDAEIVHDNLSGFVANEHINHANVNINAGKGLTGGGDITTSRTIDIDSANVRAMFSGGTGITYNNTSGEFTTTDNEIVHDNLSGFVADEHINHTNVNINAGAGLTGGGDITSSRTLNVVGGDGITANADEIEVTVDNSTIELSATDGSGVVRVKDGGITNVKLQYDSSTIGTTSIVLGGSTTTLAGLTQIDVDNVRILDNTVGTSSGDLILDPAPLNDSTGTVVILGDLQVNGTTTTINSNDLSVKDKNIIIADSASSSSQADGAGITVGAYTDNPKITYRTTGDKWEFNKDVAFADSDDLILPDKSKILLGDGADLQLYHDGSHSRIRNLNTGSLFIENFQSSGFVDIRANDGSGSVTSYLAADGSTGEALLYHYGSQKLATKSTGVDVTGEVTADSATISGNLTVTAGITQENHRFTSSTITTTATTQVNLDTFSPTTYSGAEVNIMAISSGERHITKLLIVHDGTTAYATEFGSVYTNTPLATYDVDLSGSVRIRVTPASATSTIFNTLVTLIEN